MRLFYLFKSLFKRFISLVKGSGKLKSKKISQINFESNKKNRNTINGDKNSNLAENNLKNANDPFATSENRKSRRGSVIKNVFSFAICIFVCLFLIFSPGFIFNKQNYQTDVSNLLLNKSGKTSVLTLWHIETFEGGSASRTKYLEKQAIAFNKSQKDCFIVVKTLTENQLFLNLEQNNYPDLFSFGIGAGYMLSSNLTSLPQNENIRDDLQEYAKINDEILAYPYMLGGYLTITREKDYNQENLQENFESVSGNKTSKQKFGFGLSTEEFTNGLKSLNFEGVFSLKRQNLLECSSSYDAYVAFLQNKIKTLVGTTRDLARCKNRELNGNLDSCVYSYLVGFSDLVQYIGVNKNLPNTKLNLAKSFAKFLTEGSAQKAISNYGLFGVTNNKIYKDDYYSEFEDKLMQKLTSVNVFSSLKDIEDGKKASLSKLLG